MTEKTQKALAEFVNMANFGGANPIDWDRFYRFCVVAFLEGDKRIGHSEFYRFILNLMEAKNKSVTEETVSPYFSTYSRCMDFADKLKLEINWS